MTEWGPWSYANANGARLGADWYYEGSDLHVTILEETQYRFSGDACNLGWYGSWGGSVGMTLNSLAGQVQAIWSGVFPQAYNSTATLTFTQTGLYNGSTPSVTFSPTLVALPPNAPTNITATWISDTQINVGWTNNPAADRPVINNLVTRHDNMAADWSPSLLPGSQASFSDTTLVADRKFSYHVTAVNAGGATQSVDSVVIYMTPAAPTNCAATKTGGGDIVVTWTNTSTYAAETPVEVWHSTDNGATWAALGTTLVGAVSYTHVQPNGAQTHRYKVRARTPSGTTRYSDYSAYSNQITLLAQPSAPTNLAQTSSVTQNGTVLDSSGTINVTWKHQPTDGTPQSSYEFEYQVSTDGGSTYGAAVNSGQVVSAVEGRNNAITVVNSRTVRWRVRTWGGHPTASPWSTYSVFTTNARPSAVALGGAMVATPVLTATGSYSDSELSPQTGAQWSLYQGGTLLETSSYGAAEPSQFLSHTFDTPLTNGASYVVAYRVQDSAGLWSTTATRNITVAFTPPEVPTLTVAFDDYSGHILVTVTNPATGEWVESNTVRRRVNGGEWGVLATDVAPNGTLTDSTAPVRGLVEYQASAITALPSSATSEITPLQVYSILDADDACDGRTAVMSGWLTSEDGTFCRAYYDLVIGETFDKVNSSLVLFSGAEYEEEISGRAKYHELSVSFSARYGKYQGATLRTNLHRNPSVEYNTTDWSKWNGFGGVAAGTRETLGGKSGLGFYRVTWSVAAGAHSGGLITQANVPTARLVTMSVWVRPSLTRTFQPSYELYVGGITTSTATGASVLCPANEWTQLSMVMQTGDTDTLVVMHVYSDDPATLPIGFTLDGDACLVEADALDLNFFDGSTPATDSYVYGWAGTAGNSTSFAYPRASIAATGPAGTRASSVDEWRTLFKKRGQFWWRDYYGNSFPVKVIAPKVGDRDSGGVTPLSMTLRRVSGATIHLAQESE